MNILLLGSGGREHALAWKMTQSPLCDKLYVCPGNAGTAAYGKNIVMNPLDFEAIGAFCSDQKIDMLVVGPEEPLVRGIYDYFQQDEDLAHIAVIGPSEEGAKLEGSKAYAKKFMQQFDIPTANYREFTAKTLPEGLDYITTQTPPIVLKADGLAAGKGVLICPSIEEAQAELKEMLSGKFGAASTTVVIEQFLKGIEFSVFVLTDGESYKILPVAKDYKRIGEGDTGLNTGGMGAVSNPPFVDAALMQKVEERIIKPTIAGLKTNNITYKGFIFIGLIMVENEPYVIEYNCRMGDPETEAVIPRLKNDLVALFQQTNNGTLADAVIETDPRSTTTIVLVAGGYPGDYEKGKIINGLNNVNNCLVFHAGTKADGDNIVTNGGRVLALTCFGDSVAEALALANNNASFIDFEGKYYRSDIGFDL